MSARGCRYRLACDPATRRRAAPVARSLVALAVVALTATACLPPPPPAASARRRLPGAADHSRVTISHCPVAGFSYGNGFGPLGTGGHHYGVDLSAPEGTPVYAVRNGTLWYWSTGDVGGYSVYLKADDGNTYYYTHLTAYAADAREHDHAR